MPDHTQFHHETSLLEIRDRVDPDVDPGIIPPLSAKRLPNELLQMTYPRIIQDTDSKSETLEFSENESIPVDPNDDGGRDTRLSYPQNVMLRLARLKSKPRPLETADMSDLLRIAGLFKL
jgi:hypothetical protein